MSTIRADDLELFYRAYNARCNAHDFDALGDFVADDVVVNGTEHGLKAYTFGLSCVVEAFPDYRWDLQHLVIAAPWIAAHFHDTGTHQGAFLGIAATGRSVSTQEFALYRVSEGKSPRCGSQPTTCDCSISSADPVLSAAPLQDR